MEQKEADAGTSCISALIIHVVTVRKCPYGGWRLLKISIQISIQPSMLTDASRRHRFALLGLALPAFKSCISDTNASSIYQLAAQKPAIPQQFLIRICTCLRSSRVSSPELGRSQMETRRRSWPEAWPGARNPLLTNSIRPSYSLASFPCSLLCTHTRKMRGIHKLQRNLE